ncbi:EI24 domain-containing protein [Roseibium sediminis]|uniref:EI24 domain-containing protein n=1 Tax=Roseibium sediminis TaxID=1775174 RepID=UPI00123DBE10|nr:EI24 domain-containing protein [Roseibium sediminis]
MIVKSLFQSFSAIGVGTVGQTLVWGFRTIAIVSVLGLLFNLYFNYGAFPQRDWLETAVIFVITLLMNFMGLISIGFVFGYALLPASILLAVLYSADLAEGFERKYYPDVAGSRLPDTRSKVLRAVGAIVITGIMALIGVFVTLLAGPFVGAGVFVAINGRLLGKEAFLLVARRHHSQADAEAIYRRNRMVTHFYGSAASMLFLVPWLGLFAHVYAVSLMVNFYHQLAEKAWAARREREGMVSEAVEKEDAPQRDWVEGPWDRPRSGS